MRKRLPHLFLSLVCLGGSLHIGCNKFGGEKKGATGDVPKDEAIPGILIEHGVNHNQYQTGTFNVTGIKVNNFVTVPFSGSEFRYSWKLISFVGHEMPNADEAFASVMIADANNLNASFRLSKPRMVPNGSIAMFCLNAASNQAAYKGYYVVVFDDGATNVVTKPGQMIDPATGKIIPALSETMTGLPPTGMPSQGEIPQSQMSHPQIPQNQGVPIQRQP